MITTPKLKRIVNGFIRSLFYYCRRTNGVRFIFVVYGYFSRLDHLTYQQISQDWLLFYPSVIINWPLIKPHIYMKCPSLINHC